MHNIRKFMRDVQSPNARRVKREDSVYWSHLKPEVLSGLTKEEELEIKEFLREVQLLGDTLLLQEELEKYNVPAEIFKADSRLWNAIAYDEIPTDKFERGVFCITKEFPHRVLISNVSEDDCLLFIGPYNYYKISLKELKKQTIKQFKKTSAADL